MPKLTLHVYDYNYSSWSMRAGLIVRASGLTFTERALARDAYGRALEPIPSGSGLLPMLVHRLASGDVSIHESLAIGEYLAELAPEARLWPEAPGARAQARSLSAEMHAGFRELRQNMPMNVRASYPGFARSPEVDREWRRIQAIWTECRSSAPEGPFLFGAFGVVDAMFAPVVMRARTYHVRLEPICEDYARAIEAEPAVVDWLAHASRETLRSARYELVVDR